ncbi:ABC transporter transmembrane domain-containing protein [Corynebacterium suedekumii]|nr:ABC transporter transmembrane domain-containing protein [Corynebacterium suedekumii]
MRSWAPWPTGSWPRTSSPTPASPWGRCPRASQPGRSCVALRHPGTALGAAGPPGHHRRHPAGHHRRGALRGGHPLLTGSAVDVATGAVDSTPATRLLSGYSPITAIIIVLVVVALARYLCQFLRRYAAGRLSIDTQHTLRIRILDTLQRLDGPGQDQIVTGQVVSRSISDLNATQGLVAMGPMALGLIVQLLITGGVMLSVSPCSPSSPWRSCPSPSPRRCSPGAPCTPPPGSPSSRPRTWPRTSNRPSPGSAWSRRFAQEEREVDRLDQLGRTLYAAKMRAAKLMARFQPMLQNLPQIALVLNILVGGWLVLRGDITVGTFFAFSVYLTSMTAIVGMLSGMIITLQMGLASLDRIADILDLTPGRTDPADPATLPAGPIGLRLDRVTLRHRRPPRPRRPHPRRTSRQLDRAHRPARLGQIHGRPAHGRVLRTR